MLKKIVLVSVVLVPLALQATRADAAPITYQLNCVFAGGTTCDSVQSVATLTLNDAVAGQVTGTLTYLDSSNKDSVWLNYTDGTTISNVTGTKVTSFTSKQDSLKPDGWGGLFDLRILFDNSQTGPYTFTIFGTGINVATFGVKDTSGNLFAAAHVQAFQGPGDTAECSRWVGSTGTGTNAGSAELTCAGTTSGESGEESTIIPEPASMLLLGTGLSFIGTQMRRRMRKQQA